MGVRRKKVLKWIPDELVEKARRMAISRGLDENQVIRQALYLGLSILEEERNILEEIREIKERLRKLEEGCVSAPQRVSPDPFIEKLVEEV